MHWNKINLSHLLGCKVERVLEVVSGFTNPFSSSVEDNELYFFLSSPVPAKHGIAIDLIEAGDTDRKAEEDDFSFSWKYIKYVFYNTIKCYKLKTCEAYEVKKKLTNSQNVISQMRA